MTGWRYYMPDNGETVEDASEIKARCYDHEDAAREAADLYHPGAEWYEGERTFAVIDPNGVEQRVKVRVEYEPAFYT